MNKKRRPRRLPNGKTTYSAAKYAAEWRQLAAPLEDAFDWMLVAFDPACQFRTPSGVLTLSVNDVRQIAAVIDARDELELRLSDAENHLGMLLSTAETVLSDRKQRNRRR